MSSRCSRLLALVGGYRKESGGTKRELISQDLLAAGPVSRILSAGKLPLAGTTYRRTAIPLGRALLRGSSDLPGGLAHRAGTRPLPPKELRAMSVERSLFAHNSRLTAHGSQLLQRQRNFLPIWSCSVWGLPCPLHYWSGGALLPHLFTLTLTLPPGRYFFCGTFRQSALTPISRTLSGTLLCGVRTFLPHRSTRQGRPSGPAAYIHIIFDDLCGSADAASKSCG